MIYLLKSLGLPNFILCMTETTLFLWFRFLFMPCLFLASCTSENAENSAQKPLILTTTNILGDVMQQLYGDKARVVSLMGPEIDPHLYIATREDLKKMQDADIVVYNGLELEGKMTEALDALKQRGKLVIAIGDYFPKERLIYEDASQPDPHIWFDLDGWLKAVEGLSEKIKEEAGLSADSNQMNLFKENITGLKVSLDSLYLEIPQARRVIITTHDAFSYFGRQFNFEVLSLQGISTVSEFGVKEMEQVVDVVVSKSIPALFLEPTVPERYLSSLKERISNKGDSIKILGPLYADALGPKEEASGNYLGMIRHNGWLIYEGLAK